MSTGQKYSTLVLLLILAATAGWILSYSLAGPDDHAQYALQLPQPMSLPDFALVDQVGLPFGPDRLVGHWTWMFFGFTHCPDICPATLQLLSFARQELQALHPGGVIPDILLISVDPDRDTPQLLRQYTAQFGDGVSAATGDIVELQKLTSGLGIFFEKQESESENYSVAHSAHVIVIDDNGNYAAVFSPPHSSEKFVTDFPVLSAAR